MVAVKLFTPEERAWHAAAFRRDQALWPEFGGMEKKCERRHQLQEPAAILAIRRAINSSMGDRGGPHC